jgi:outer membrane protein TolC
VDYEKAVLEYETKVRTALLEVKLLTGELDRSHEKLSNARKRVELAQQNDRSYDVKYNSGAMSYNDFLNNKLMLRSYILNLLKEVQTQLNYEAELYNALGGSQKTDNNQQADGL